MTERGEGFDSMEWTSLRESRKPPSKRLEWMETAKELEVERGKLSGAMPGEEKLPRASKNAGMEPYSFITP